MRKNLSIIKIINTIIQKQQQHKIVCFFKVTNKIQINLLNFLWKNKIIYGFVNGKHIINVFLKPRKKESPHIFIKINKFFTLNNISKLKKWSVNNFFIVNQNTNFLSIKQIYLKKIGGYISYKIS